MQPEGRITRAIRAMIAERGGFVFKVWGSDHMMAGLPDLIGCYRGIFFAFEVKTPVGTVSKRQWFVMRAIKRAGGIVAVPRSVADASNVLDDIDTWCDTFETAMDTLKTGLQMQQLKPTPKSPEGDEE